MHWRVNISYAFISFTASEIYISDYSSRWKALPLLSSKTAMPRRKSKSLDQRRKQSAGINRRRRAQETPEAAEARRALVRAGMQRLRAQETPEAAETRRARDRDRKRRQRNKERLQRAEKTAEAPQNVCVSQKNRMQNHSRVKRKKDALLGESAAIFMSKTTERPMYACCSCHQLYYRSSVLEMKAERYRLNHVIEDIIKASNDVQSHGRSWICNTCHGSLKRGMVPTKSWASGLVLDDIPADLRPLQ